MIKVIKVLALVVAIFLSGMVVAIVDDVCAQPVHNRWLQVEAAMLHIVTRGIPKHDIAPNAGNAVLRDPAWRTELAAAIVDAGHAHGVPVWFLVAVAYREGSFRREPVGKIGETSTFQITPRTARHFGCDMATTGGQADCSTRIIRHWWDQCGTLGGGFMRYATGRAICSPDTKRLLWMRWDRLGIAEILREKFGQSAIPPNRIGTTVTTSEPKP